MGAPDQFPIEGPVTANALQAATVALIAQEAWANGYILQFSTVDNKLHLVALPSAGLTFVSVNAPLTGDGTPGSPLDVSPASGAAAGSMSAAAFLQLAALPSALALPVSVANGGTGSSTLTAHAVLVGNGASTPAAVGPSASTGKLLTSQGASADPTFEDPITATGDSVDLPVSPLTFTDATSFVDSGIQVALPSGGTFWLAIDMLLNASSGTPSLAGDEMVNMRLYDVTAAAVVTGSDRGFPVLTQGATEGYASASATLRVTVASARTIKVQVRADPGSGSDLTANINSAAVSGLSQLNWMKRGN